MPTALYSPNGEMFSKELRVRNVCIWIATSLSLLAMTYNMSFHDGLTALSNHGI